MAVRIVDALVSRGTVYERDVWMGSGTENKRHNKYCIIINSGVYKSIVRAMPTV